MRLIDADALLQDLKKTDRYFMLKADLDNAPTVPLPDFKEKGGPENEDNDKQNI